MRSSALTVVGVLALLGGSARAEPTPPSTPATPQAPHASVEPEEVVVPTLSLSGTTSGKGKLSVGLDVRNSVNKAWETHFAPSFTVSSADGVANLLAISSNGESSGPPEWAIGFTMSAVDRNPEALQSPIVPPELFDAYAICRARAQLPDASVDEKAFYVEHAKLAADLVSTADAQVRAAIAAKAKDTLKPLPPSCGAAETLASCDNASLRKVLVELAPTCATVKGDACTWLAGLETGLSASKLCARGRDLLKPQSEETQERSRYPKHILAIGLTYGETTIKNLVGEPGPAAALKLMSDSYASIVFGALYTYVEPGKSTHFSFELPIVVKSSYKAPSTTAKWCIPSGTVTTKDGSGPAETCDEQPLGALTHPLRVSTALLFGIAAPNGVFRGAIGPTFSYDLSSTSSLPYQLGVQAPLYFSVTKAASASASDYEGIVRLVPSFAMSNTDKGLSPTGTITLELLGKRTMFGSSLYWP